MVCFGFIVLKCKRGILIFVTQAVMQEFSVTTRKSIMVRKKRNERWMKIVRTLNSFWKVGG